MSELIMNKKTVAIREEKRFCRSPRFSSVFPKKLNGILHPDEFHQSISNINQACRPTFPERVLILILFSGALIGLVVFITGILAVCLRISSMWIPLMSVGFVLMMAFLTVAIFVSSRVYRLCDARLDRAVDAESKKYSTRTSNPMKWRLDMTIFTRRYSTTLPSDIQYYLLIEIGHQRTTQSIDASENSSKSLLNKSEKIVQIKDLDHIDIES